MKKILYTRICFFSLIFLVLAFLSCGFCVSKSYATEPSAISNPNFIINAPRTSPYADHPDLWQGRTVLQVPLQKKPHAQDDTANTPLTLDPAQPYIEQSSPMVQTEMWYPQGGPRSDEGELWKEGASFEDMNRVDLHRLDLPDTNKEMASVNDMVENTRGGYATNSEVFMTPLNTRDSIASQLKNIAEYHTDNVEYGEDVQQTQEVADMEGRSTDQDTTWRAEVTEPMKIDEDVLSSKRNIVGAYVNMQGDNMQFFVGPELHIPDSSPLETHNRDLEDSELGLGMQMLWDF